MADAGNPSSRAIACDLFQLVDLDKLQSTREKSSEVVLELSAKFLDARSYNSQPSVTFFCQIYLFRGNPQDIHEHWPEAIRDAISSGSAEVTTLGDSGWREITARCLVPDPVQFAVVHLAARPNLRVPMPDGLFVDQVELVAKIYAGNYRMRISLWGFQWNQGKPVACNAPQAAALRAHAEGKQQEGGRLLRLFTAPSMKSNEVEFTAWIDPLESIVFDPVSIPWNGWRIGQVAIAHRRNHRWHECKICPKPH